jgi:hypothetical protein
MCAGPSRLVDYSRRRTEYAFKFTFTALSASRTAAAEMAAASDRQSQIAVQDQEVCRTTAGARRRRPIVTGTDDRSSISGRPSARRNDSGMTGPNAKQTSVQQPELRRMGDVFGDRVIATAILGRLLHHAVTLSICGNSFRLKEKLKAGLVRAEETTES